TKTKMIDFFMIIVAFGAIFSSIYFIFFDEEIDSKIQKRLLDIKEGKTERKGSGESDTIYEALAKREASKKLNILEMLKDQSEYRIPILGLLLNKFKYIDLIKDLLKKADIKMPVDVVFIIAGSLFLPFLVLSMLNNNLLFLLMGAGAAFSPILFIKMKIKERQKVFAQFFPDSLGIIANSLRAGHSLLAAFQMVASESPYPVNRLFKTVSDEISLGKEVREAMQDMNNYMPDSQDLRFFVTAVLIQKEIGGNLAEILDTLNVTIREREKLMGLIRTQTAQAQMSGLVLGLAPVFISILVTLMNPAYMEPLFNTTMGNLALFGAFMMSFTGFMIIRKVTEIRV
ncbi:MAG TPA: type II secretion system F family protein, partial [Candidatus Gastranaerophilales bacterium]|nr:type II secretion system F family protein [Candidatus Gastranaerophilales bacterium]